MQNKHLRMTAKPPVVISYLDLPCPCHVILGCFYFSDIEPLTAGSVKAIVNHFSRNRMVWVWGICLV